MAAYQLALGRQEDFDLPALELRSALASTGKALFMDSGNLFEPGHKNCNACHFNGGGTAALTLDPTDAVFRVWTAVPWIEHRQSDEREQIPLALTLPRDGGFGQVPTVFGSFGNTDDLPPPFGHFEIEEFNSPPVVESADTGPFFHNHTVADLESAVAFYGSAAFKASLVPTLIPIDISEDPNDPEVLAIAAFLRVLNALENIRSAIDVAERGRTITAVADRLDLARLSLAETVDALEVLAVGALAVHERAGCSVRSGQTGRRQTGARSGAAPADPVAIDNLLGVAGRHLRDARRALADPATLPPTFRN